MNKSEELTEDKKSGSQDGRLNGLVSLRGAKRRSNLIQNKEYANDKIANKGNIMRLPRSLRSLAMTGVNKDTDLAPYCLSALVPKKAAFTLAEVLITLGIIGVVAAITIPNMITNYQKKVTVNKLKKVYSELQQAIKLSVAENGDMGAWEFGNGNNIEDSIAISDRYIAPYIKVLKKCGTDTTGDCNFQAKFLNGNSASPYYTTSNSEKLFLMNGSELLIRKYNTYVFITVDLNGTKAPNTYGKDIFTMELVPRTSRIAFRWEGQDRETLISGSFSCNKDVAYGGFKCGALIKADNWTISKDYPW